MKKSVSAPNLTNAKFMAASPPQPLKMKKSISTNALPLDVSHTEMSPLYALNYELQFEAMFHVTGAQAGTCALSHGTFPYEILNTNEEPAKDMAACLLEPSECEEQPHRPWRHANQRTTDICTLDSERSRRFSAIMRRRRKGSKN